MSWYCDISPSRSCFIPSNCHFLHLSLSSYYGCVSVFTSVQMKLVFEHGLHTHTNIHTCSFLWYVSCARVCVHVDSLEESQKARRSLLCYLLYKYNMIVLSLSFALALSCVSGSCSLLLQVLIINDWDIKKPKKQFLLRFFDSHRVAFDSLLFFF